MLGEIVVFFRGEDGAVAALADPCPHRGESLSGGRCHFKGFLTCCYHGWTFDQNGECVAVLGEGTESVIPGQATARARRYPTAILGGMVFVWMGDGPAAPAEEDIPPEFFRPDSQILQSSVVWECNWRPAMENFFDAHIYYVHRNSGRLLSFSYSRLFSAIHCFDGKGAQAPRVVNNRALAFDRAHLNSLRGDGEDPEAHSDVPSAREMPSGVPFQYTFPALNGAKWPKTRLRYYIARSMSMFWRNSTESGIEPNVEWSMLHLPAIIRVINRRWIYSRITVPVSETTSRIFYIHARYPGNRFKRILNRISFHVFYNWWFNRNFSGQDKRVVENQYYDRPEKFSPSDLIPKEWRKLIVGHARTTDGLGLRHRSSPHARAMP